MSEAVNGRTEEEYVLNGGKFRKKYIPLDIFSFIAIAVFSRFIIFNVEQRVIEQMPFTFWGGLLFFSFCIYMAWPRILLNKYAIFLQATDVVGKHFEGNMEDTMKFALELQKEGATRIPSSKETGKPVRLTYALDDDGVEIITVKSQ